jgi:hypothetical protein
MRRALVVPLVAGVLAIFFALPATTARPAPGGSLRFDATGQPAVVTPALHDDPALVERRQERRDRVRRNDLSARPARETIGPKPARLSTRNGTTSCSCGGFDARMIDGGADLNLAGGASARLALSSIESGGSSIYGGGSALYVPTGPNEIAAQRGPVVERFRGINSGIEQLFDLAQPMQPAGDLTFHVAVTTNVRGPADGASAETLTFWSGQHIAFTYGKVVTIDAAGKSVPSDVTWLNGELTFTVPGSFLASAEYPVVVDPVIGTFITLPQSTTVYSPGVSLDVTYNATADEYFFVYNDLPGADGDVQGVIINPTTGAVGAPINIDVGATTDLANPSVSWNAANNRYLVVYSQINTATQGLEIMGRVLDATGAPVTTAVNFNISNGVAATVNEFECRVMSNGTNWLVVWMTIDAAAAVPEGNIMGRIVNGTSTNGSPSFGTAPFVIANTADNERQPCAAFGPGGNFLVSWRDTTANGNLGAIQGKTVTAAGVPSVTTNTYNVVTATQTVENQSVTANMTAGEFLVGWDQYLGTGAGDPVVRRVTSGGVGTGAIVVVDTDATNDALDVTVQWNAAMNMYFVGWFDDAGTAFAAYEVQGARLNGTTAAVIQTDIPLTNPGQLATTTIPITAAAQRTAAAGATHVILCYRVVPAAPPYPAQAIRFDMNSPPTDPVPASMIQKQGPAATAPTDAEGVVYLLLPRQESFSGGVSTDPEAQMIRLQIERILNSAAFTGAFTEQSALVASGGSPTITVSGIANGIYKWRARFVDALGTAGNWVEFGAAGGPDHEFNVPNQIPPAPAIAQLPTTQGQYRMDGTTSIALGGVTPEGTVILKGTIGADADGDNVRLEVEVQPAGSAFTGVATVTSAFGPAGNHQVSFTPVTSGAGYRWQAWTRDSSGAPIAISAAVDFGANGTASDFARDLAANTTNAPTALAQFEANGITPIAIGGTAAARTVVLRANVTDPNGDTVAVEVEAKPIGTAFDGAGLLQGPFVGSGNNSQVTFSLPAALSTASYQWRARTIDSLGAVSAFVEFQLGGGVDFILPAVDPGGSRNNLGCPLGAAGAASSWLVGLLCLLSLLALRRR